MLKFQVFVLLFRFYALSSKIEKPFSNEGKDLVIQFSVKHEQNIDCGGGYVKVFPSTVDISEMHGESPYNIMFGRFLYSCMWSKFFYDDIFELKKKTFSTRDLLTFNKWNNHF